MATDESHDEALPKTAHAGRRWILPVYHGNGAETDLVAVGDIDWMPVFSRFTRHQQICIRVKPADASRDSLSICNKTGNCRIDPFWWIPAHPFSTICCHGDAAKPSKTGVCVWARYALLQVTEAPFIC